MRRMLALMFVPVLALAQSPEERAVRNVLDDWHLAAAQADEGRYFGHLAEEAVFLGTDATERWDKRAFQTYAHPHFAKGKAWSFRATRRTVTFIANGKVAIFEEDLATPNLGPARGSGVLEKRGGAWKLLQYNLSVPIPNALMDGVRDRIAKHLESRAKH
jgi:ketosteroid isomerase-like protein